MMVGQIILTISLFLFLSGAIFISYQIFKIVELDARARGLNAPELWGLSAAGRGNLIGLILYFKHRENYPIKNFPPNKQAESLKRKRWAVFALFSWTGCCWYCFSHLLAQLSLKIVCR